VSQVSEKKRNDALDLQTYNLQNYKTKIKMDKVEFNKQAKLSDKGHLPHADTPLLLQSI